MGYAGEEVSLAVKRYGVDIPIDILIDSIDVVRHSEATSDGEMGDPYNSLTFKKKGLNESLKNTWQIKFPKRKHIDLEEDCYETNRRVKLKGKICKVNRLILRSWWEKTHQKGKLIEVGDVKNLTKERLDQMINSIGGFDLIIGGSPCNNLIGSNRCTRHGLAGEQSSLFYEFPRIVKYVRGAMRLKLT
ncbi:hypothetical protein SUGI_0653480 [Cryptomeria japonica]|nr:hypothetical protein SUGI_0653480 [Cryptomeria japonica]